MNKLKSRKFIVWILWATVAVVSMFRPDLPKETIFEFFGFISMVYIGGNVAQDYLIGRANKPTKGAVPKEPNE